jgi:hypothetical protein
MQAYDVKDNFLLKQLSWEKENLYYSQKMGELGNKRKFILPYEVWFG